MDGTAKRMESNNLEHDPHVEYIVLPPDSFSRNSLERVTLISETGEMEMSQSRWLENRYCEYHIQVSGIEAECEESCWIFFGYVIRSLCSKKWFILCL